MFASVFIPGEPVPKERPRFRKLPNGAITTYTPKTTQDKEQFVAECIRKAYPTFIPFEGQVRMSMTFHMPIPKTKKLIYHDAVSECIKGSSDYFVYDKANLMLNSIYNPCKKCKPDLAVAYVPQYPTTRPDIDNLMKLQLDGIQKSGIILDDKQVVSLLVKKIYSHTPGVLLEMQFGGEL